MELIDEFADNLTNIRHRAMQPPAEQDFQETWKRVFFIFFFFLSEFCCTAIDYSSLELLWKLVLGCGLWSMIMNEMM